MVDLDDGVSGITPEDPFLVNRMVHLVRDFLATHPDFAIDPISAGEGGAPEISLASQGWLRILPHHAEGGLDGFFIARLRRRED